MKKPTWILILIIMAFPLSIYACTYREELKNVDATLLPTIQVTAIKTETESFINKNTPSSIIPIGSSTPTVNLSATVLPTITRTIIPTLNSADRERAVRSLLIIAGSCHLPCFLDIDPGRSTWEEVRAHLMGLGFQWSKPYDPYNSSFTANGKIYNTSMGSSLSPYTLSISPLVINDSIDSLHFQLGGSKAFNIFPNYAFSNLVQLLGSPSRIWMTTDYRDGFEKAIFDFWAFYDQKGIVLKGQVVGSLSGNEFNICPKKTDDFQNNQNGNPSSINVYTQDLKSTRKLEDLVEIWGEKIPNLPYSVDEASGRSITEATKLSPKDFYNILADNSLPDCFKTPRSLWESK